MIYMSCLKIFIDFYKKILYNIYTIKKIKISIWLFRLVARIAGSHLAEGRVGTSKSHQNIAGGRLESEEVS